MSKRFLIRWLLISLGLHLLAAVFSLGYQNSDEHFQILEFLNAFQGRTPVSALPIEYTRMIRPWLQPFLYWLPERGLHFAGIDSPFAWAFADRILSALIGWFSVVGLALCIPIWIAQIRWQKIAVIALALTWYLPAFHARHSSENLSGALLVIGLCGLVYKGKLDTADQRKLSPAILFGAGALWGLAFEARYQVGFMVAGGILWLAIIARLRLRDLAFLSAGIGAAIGFGTYLDFLGYGQWTFAPWNYFKMNLIEGYASSTDVSPWWDYFRRIWTETWPVLGFVLLGSSLFFWARQTLDVLTWTHAPLFIVHMAIAHKEMRFLFPLAHAAPVFLILSLVLPHAGKTVWETFSQKKFLRALCYGMIGLNFIGLAAFTFLPASPGIRFYKKVYELKLSKLYYSDGDNPYVLAGIPMYFYRPEGIQMISIESIPPASQFWYASPSQDLAPEWTQRCHPIQRSVPHWTILKHLRNWTLYQCDAK